MGRGDARSSLLVLLLALLCRGRAHGYALMAGLRHRAGPALDYPEGSVYPVLQQMERDGLVRSNREIVDGRSRRVYEVTERGRAYYAEQREAWLEYLKAMSTILEG
ncbi:PadR family transcriptional regulator [Haloechinothrix sp. YIM 98757]|uniref:PadR family transcriptional regulator n=1 Tax=Haloechinothrix aidingensis TaxID=2752311 RepID=A0A837ZZ16_9PSEU|nr:PadR family transcriptional regulator [Haloechinothrix aidingensis]MBA0125856.1 PadR family transcriptional regulator [Haloechinothrix aidingensis]